MLVGVLIIAAATHAGIVAKGGYSSLSVIPIGLALGLACGSVFIGAAWRDGRRILAVVIGLCLFAGEVVVMASTAERVIDSREAASEPARVLAIRRVKAQKRVDTAKEAKDATTSPRIEEAIAAKQRAEASVTSEAAKKGCAVNCRALLQSAVDDARTELAAARAELDKVRREAERELSSAETELAEMPAPRSETPLADKLGLPGWALDLTIAGLSSFAVNGLGALLIAFGAHGHHGRKGEVEIALKQSDPTPASKEPVSRPAMPISNKDHAAKFGLECLEASADAETSLSDIGEAYLRWCKRSNLPPLRPAALGSTMAKLFEDAGLPVHQAGDDLYVTGVQVRADVTALRVIPHMPETVVANTNRPAKMKLRSA